VWERFTWDRVAQQTAAFCESLLQQRVRCVIPLPSAASGHLAESLAYFYLLFLNTPKCYADAIDLLILLSMEKLSLYLLGGDMQSGSYFFLCRI
jgi:hypothetical protein